MSNFATRLRNLTVRFADRPYYPGIVALVAASDYFVPGSPSNAIFIGSILPRTSQWRRLSLFFAVGCAAGAFLLATLIGSHGEAFVGWVTQSEAADPWQRLEALIAVYGLVALAALAATSAPVRIAVAILALSGHTPLAIGAIVLAGRLVAYPTLAWLVASSPALISKIPLRQAYLYRPRQPRP